MIKKILILLLIFSSGFNVYSTTLEELISSYNFSYNEPGLKINLDNYSLNENSILNINLSFIILYNEYELVSRIYSNKSNTNILNSTKLILKDNNKINLSYNISKLYSSNYSFQLAIKEEERIIYRNYKLFEIEILNPNISNPNIKEENFITIEDLPKLEIEKESLPDIIVKFFSHNQNNKSINITIKNIGSKYIGPFYYEIYNENLEKVSQKYIEFLKQKESTSHYFNYNINSSEFIIYLDSYNFHEEENEINNIYFWPEEKIKKQENKFKVFSNKKSKNKKGINNQIENNNLIIEKEKISKNLNKTQNIEKNNSKIILEMKTKKINNISSNQNKNNKNQTLIKSKTNKNSFDLFPIIAIGGIIIGFYFLISI